MYRAQTRSALEKQERVSGTWLWLRKWFGDGNAKDHLDFVAMGARPIRHREFTRRCFMELRASESVSIESSTGFEQILLKCAKLHNLQIRNSCALGADFL